MDELGDLNLWTNWGSDIFCLGRIGGHLGGSTGRFGGSTGGYTGRLGGLLGDLV
uniref:Uncharacterized protein n=1 Tax=Meloidogyne enterolobii TaxID=390850 RepID=A0A6V7WR59_MELEN|nr:unnamed protein product [Meloidogyne enterolobii]